MRIYTKLEIRECFSQKKIVRFKIKSKYLVKISTAVIVLNAYARINFHNFVELVIAKIKPFCRFRILQLSKITCTSLIRFASAYFYFFGVAMGKH